MTIASTSRPLGDLEKTLHDLVQHALEFRPVRFSIVAELNKWVDTGWFEKQVFTRAQAATIEYRITQAGMEALAANYYHFSKLLGLEFMNVSASADIAAKKLGVA